MGRNKGQEREKSGNTGNGKTSPNSLLMVCCQEGGKGTKGRTESLKEENLFSNENWNTRKEHTPTHF